MRKKIILFLVVLILLVSGQVINIGKYHPTIKKIIYPEYYSAESSLEKLNNGEQITEADRSFSKLIMMCAYFTVSGLSIKGLQQCDVGIVIREGFPTLNPLRICPFYTVDKVLFTGSRTPDWLDANNGNFPYNIEALCSVQEIKEKYKEELDKKVSFLSGVISFLGIIFFVLSFILNKDYLERS